jgi:DNA-binding LacI/PurR family transcriptional regulator
MQNQQAAKMKRVTITDVAIKAGVSKSTVSHVINQTRFVEEDTKQRVLQTIQELKYRPSSIARSLVSQQTRTAGLIISDVGNPFYHDVIRGVEEVAQANGYLLFLYNTSYNLELGMRFIHSMVDRFVDGVMFMSSNMNIEMLQEVYQSSIESVVLDWGSTDISKMASTITIDFTIGIHEAVQHLASLGHKSIAFAGGPKNMWTHAIRKQAFLDAVNNVDSTIRPIILPEGDLRIEGGYRSFEALTKLPQRTFAVIAANDLTALGILWAARNAKYDLPNDLSVIGLDDIDLASRVTPTLTTIALPRYEIGKLAMEELLALIRNSSQPKTNQVVTTKLIVRNSTAPAPNRGAD